MVIFFKSPVSILHLDVLLVMGGTCTGHNIAPQYQNFFSLLYPVFLDLPAPWDAVETAKQALKVSCCCFI